MRQLLFRYTTLRLIWIAVVIEIMSKEVGQNLPAGGQD
jgi:hypothetical protein